MKVYGSNGNDMSFGIKNASFVVVGNILRSLDNITLHWTMLNQIII